MNLKHSVLRKYHTVLASNSGYGCIHICVAQVYLPSPPLKTTHYYSAKERIGMRDKTKTGLIEFCNSRISLQEMHLHRSFSIMGREGLCGHGSI